MYCSFLSSLKLNSENEDKYPGQSGPGLVLRDQPQSKMVKGRVLCKGRQHTNKLRRQLRLQQSQPSVSHGDRGMVDPDHLAIRFHQ